MTQERRLKLPKSKLNKIQSLGKLEVYELDLKAVRFIPPTFDPDYEGKIGSFKIPHVSVRHTEKPSAVGAHSLLIENQSGDSNGYIFSHSKRSKYFKRPRLYFVYFYKGPSSKSCCLSW